MKKILVIAFVALFLTSFTPKAEAYTEAERQALIAQIIAKIAELQAQINLIISQQNSAPAPESSSDSSTPKTPSVEISLTSSGVAAADAITYFKGTVHNASSCLGLDWDFGDGTRSASFPGCKDGDKLETQNVTGEHRYLNSRQYNVKLTVDDGGTLIHSNTLYITVPAVGSYTYTYTPN